MPRLVSRKVFPLNTLADAARLGRAMAAALSLCNPGALLLSGPVGAGKTTLVRFLVESLPGGREAEISSPSFTIANIYCTAPVAHHFDLYRLDSGLPLPPEASLEESLENPQVVTIVEWPERLAAGSLPPARVVCDLRRGLPRRTNQAVLAGFGATGRRFLDLLPGISRFPGRGNPPPRLRRRTSSAKAQA
jgi:tRNA threonylcarbamoyladenosine biosynthesis protein TsaE